jgi:hypothetical protein
MADDGGDREGSPMRPLRVVVLILGTLTALLAFALLAGGGVLVWGHTTQLDRDGFFFTHAERLTSSSYALTSGALDLGSRPADWLPADVATLRIRSEGPDDVFIGIAPTGAVRRYLRDVAYTRVTSVSTGPFHATYEQVQGSASPAPPERQSFWEVTARGGELRWTVASGRWSIVVMNPDASAGVTADLAVGIKSELLLPIGIAMLVIGVLLALAAVAMIVGATRRRARETSIDRRRPPRPDGPADEHTPTRPDELRTPPAPPPMTPSGG